jgi:hypothetical protein
MGYRIKKEWAMAGTEDVEIEIERVTRPLTDAGGDVPPAEEVAKVVRDCFAARHDPRIKDFVGLFAERDARTRLSLAR